jgi:cell division septal protein FtsQ
MKHFHSEQAFKKYKPQETWRQKMNRVFRKKQRILETTAPVSHYTSNPFKTPQKPNRAKLMSIILAMVTISWAGCLAYLPYFKISAVDYFGLENTTKQELQDFLNQKFLRKKNFLPLPWDNYFFVNTESITKKLSENFSFEKIEVTKVFPNKLEITIIEKISSVIYDNGQKYFLLDSEGTVTKFLTDVESGELKIKTTPAVADFDNNTNTTSTFFATATTTTSTYEHTPNNAKITDAFGKYPIIYDRRNLPVHLKQTNILPAQYIEAILQWNKYLNEEGKATPKFFILDDLNSGIVIDTVLSWNILFQPKNDTQVQIDTLKEILPTIKPKQYVDLRFGEKVYWK